ncbi:uncharacterized protein LAJ45_03889 [Morchella importuna]|uniref:MARVEL domain-containing protein n=1 Tax=Morchella conica CCBAS932 TaxID=1392247 RepID=A0A3N4L1H6_9PEZI|nr:uncharacterized protein LAJ45_03889 [Morchella importuna]KAH8151896.1 hypothetical protein LAJ45_03889 [Morchella importuna]RPB16663.1 hypothetical protein P167DRAFT_541996 [Morchella conica CCBAS932]
MPRSSLHANGALGYIFLASRCLQLACLITTLGLSAHLIGAMADAMQQPSSALIGTLCISIFTLLYAIITLALYYDAQLPAHYAAATDAVFLLALLVTTIVVGKPLAFLSCRAVGIFAENSAGAYVSVSNNVGFHAKRGDLYLVPLEYAQWVVSSVGVCEMMKGVWAVGIVVTVLFAASAVCLVCLWRKGGARRGGKWAGVV